MWSTYVFCENHEMCKTDRLLQSTYVDFHHIEKCTKWKHVKLLTVVNHRWWG